MIREAEEFAEEDKLAKEKIDAKNQLDNYIFSVKNNISDPEKLGKKLSEEDKKTVNDAIKETEEWIRGHSDATKEENEEQYKRLESKCNPIIQKASAGMPQGGKSS